MEVTNVTIKVVRNNLKTEDGTVKARSVHFFSLPSIGDTPIAEEKVNLSRKGENPICWFPLADLQGHNNHAPSFNSEGDRDVYIKRVLDDIQETAQVSVTAQETETDIEVGPMGIPPFGTISQN